VSDLTAYEKNQLEKLLGMSGGYVLDFTNRSFEDFVNDSVGLNINDARYQHASGSKANLLRGFWRNESNAVVAKLLADLIDHAASMDARRPDPALLDSGKSIASRLSKNGEVPDLEFVLGVDASGAFASLAKSISQSIDNGEPEAALDRLHTLLVKYVRGKCAKHKLHIAQDKPLHSAFGEYIKVLKQTGRIQSDMTERILKSFISSFEAFNHVRNHQSFAHDNELLQKAEALFIF
jgi:hypothetical protein